MNTLRVLQRLVPRGMAGRLLLAVLAALGIAQIGLALVLQERKNMQVRDVIERQAMMQTVMAVQLLREASVEDAKHILGLFNPVSACGTVIASPPGLAVRDHGEERFAETLRQRLGDATSTLPLVRIIRLEGHGEQPACPQFSGSDGPNDHGRPLQVTSYVKLGEGRWLEFTSVVEFPATESLQIALMFLLASLLVGAVAVLSVRTQTKSLVALADASDRLGRGETVPPLADGGPVEVAAAARAFNTMQERLKGFMDDRLKMLAAISHDLRTPLTTMRLKAEFVRNKPARQSLIDTIDEMVVITDAALAFTRAEATQEPTKALDLAKLAMQLRDEYATKGLKVEVGECTSSICMFREVALKRALRNLIDNALRYGGNADLSVLQSDGSAILTVEDNGPGIADGQLNRVFEPFVRLETSRSKDTGGIGMGLSIAQGIVKAHGGSIVLSNKATGGLRVKVTLPLARG
jgi:signal transduction histidine kinase